MERVLQTQTAPESSTETTSRAHRAQWVGRIAISRTYSGGRIGGDYSAPPTAVDAIEGKAFHAVRASVTGTVRLQGNDLRHRFVNPGPQRCQLLPVEGVADDHEPVASKIRTAASTSDGPTISNPMMPLCVSRWFRNSPTPGPALLCSKVTY